MILKFKDQQRIFANGIDAETGQYLVTPLSIRDFIDTIRGKPDSANLLDIFSSLLDSIGLKGIGGMDDKYKDDFNQVGWGIVFHDKEDQEVIQSFIPLINHRKEMVGEESLIKILRYKDGQAWQDWLENYGVAPGVQDPEIIPYYLLIVGSPERIPFSFSRLLDVEYAVGRLHFDDPIGYKSYIDSLIHYETVEQIDNSRDVVYFATMHQEDLSTQLSRDNLVCPLADGLEGDNIFPRILPIAEEQNFHTKKILGNEAIKARIVSHLENPLPPSLLFTASHGIGYRNISENQLDTQGALVCQDWPGYGEISLDDCLTISDLSKECSLNGMVVFSYACFSAGTPLYDQFLRISGARPRKIALHPFISALPKGFLSHRNGGALAWIGHIDRTWSTSFMTRNQRIFIQPFRNALQRILAGKPIGYAMKDFNERFAALSAGISEAIHQMELNRPVAEHELIENWIMRNDAGGYAIIGDPASRLRIDKIR